MYSLVIRRFTDWTTIKRGRHNPKERCTYKPHHAPNSSRTHAERDFQAVTVPSSQHVVVTTASVSGPLLGSSACPTTPTLVGVLLGLLGNHRHHHSWPLTLTRLHHSGGPEREQTPDYAVHVDCHVGVTDPKALLPQASPPLLANQLRLRAPTPRPSFVLESSSMHLPCSPATRISCHVLWLHLQHAPRLLSLPTPCVLHSLPWRSSYCLSGVTWHSCDLPSQCHGYAGAASVKPCLRRGWKPTLASD